MKNQLVTEEIRDTLHRILRAGRDRSPTVAAMHFKRHVTLYNKGKYNEFRYNGP
jgi:hypothetical protein